MSSPRLRYSVLTSADSALENYLIVTATTYAELHKPSVLLKDFVGTGLRRAQQYLKKIKAPLFNSNSWSFLASSDFSSFNLRLAGISRSPHSLARLVNQVDRCNLRLPPRKRKANRVAEATRVVSLASQQEQDMSRSERLNKFRMCVLL